MLKRILVLIFAFLPIFVQPVKAELCTIDVVPSATLLLPYFEVDLTSETGQRTSFSINNATTAPVIAQVTLWTDWGLPSHTFSIFLTGYDVTQINLQQVFTDTSMPADELVALQNAHAGYQVASLGGCVGDALNGVGDCANGCPPGTIARGYVTIDSVNEISETSPADLGYFIQGDLGVANNDNVLWGDFFYFDETSGTFTTNPLVHIEADDSLGLGFGGPAAETGYTFYGRFFGPLGTFRGADNREPLGSSWAVRYYNEVLTTTDFVVWRDSTDQPVTGTGFTCGLCEDGAGPRWCPLGQTQVVCFDDSGDLIELCNGENCFPRETQRISVADLGTPFSFGWCFLNLNNNCTKCFPGGAPWPAGSGDLAQSHVIPLHSSPLGYAGSLSATALGGSCQSTSITVP